MTDTNGGGSEKYSLSDFEAQLSKLRSQQLEEDAPFSTSYEAAPTEDQPAASFSDAAPAPAEEAAAAPAEAQAPASPTPKENTAPSRPRPRPRPSGEGERPRDPRRPAAAEGERPAQPRRRPPRQNEEEGSRPERKKSGGQSVRAGGKPAPKKSAPVYEEDDDAYFERKRNNPVRNFFRFVGRSLQTVLLTVLILVIGVLGAIIIVCRGPSADARRLFVLSTNETSALKSVPRYFLPGDVVDAILHPVVEEVEPDDFVELATESETIAKENEGESEIVQVDVKAAKQELEILDIKGPTYKGKMMIIHDPYKVKLASLEQFGEYGIFLTEFIEKYGAVAGTNAGGFYDPDGQGNGGTPDGLVIRDGKIAFGSPYSKYVDVIGFDSDRVLHCGDMTAQEALDMGIVEAISFSAGPVLITDGVKRTGLGGGVNPRTCIGQRADGAVLLMVLEGRHPDSLGATYDDLANIMEEYGAVNAGNLDGGSSSAMIYNGEQITRGSTIIGSRRMATAILVLP